MEIKGLSGGNYTHQLGAKSYKLEVDPSALFTLLFLEPDEFPDYTPDQLVPLNYSFFGQVNQLSDYSGVWTDVTMLVPNAIQVVSEEDSHTVNVTIFIAIGTPPDTGLRGTLGVCVTPITDDW